MAARDPITCHVLDTAAGRPAAGVRVRLEHRAESQPAAAAAVVSVFEARTDADGRIATWQPAPASDMAAPPPPAATVAALLRAAAPARWTLRFDTEAYYGESNTFFPEATVVFRAREGQHYHVPLLLSPYSYTTYRGS